MTDKTANEHDARELFLFAANEPGLYGNQAQNIMDNLAEHIAKRRYDSGQARKAFYHLADAAARKYGEQHAGEQREGLRIFGTAERQAAADELLAHYAEEIRDKAAERIGPETLGVRSRDFSRDVNGNPTAHYEVEGRRVTKRRIQTGYDSAGSSGGREAIAKAGYRSPWYDLESYEGSRSDGDGIYMTFRRQELPAIT